jgi:hypothetical protein
MNSRATILFNDSLTKALDVVRGYIDTISTDVTLVRDFTGRIHILLAGSRESFTGERLAVLDSLTAKLSDSLGAYALSSAVSVFFESELYLEENNTTHPDRQLLASEAEHRIWLLDRQITGQDWMRPPFARSTKNPRFTFFGIKGGVGRSTALSIWAWHLAGLGNRVLLFDLDLESPGVSSTLLPSDSLPDYGIVDWFVEGGVGQEEMIEPEMTATSPIGRDCAGDILVVPAFGRKTGEYLPKLSRCYLDQPGSGGRSWATRLNYMIEQLEKMHRPDVVIFDSRAGIHDIAAVAVTRLDAEALLFAVDSFQTWMAYALLFQSWKKHPALDSFRHRIQLVGPMIPETDQEKYRDRLLQNSWDVFRDGIYDEESGADQDVFSFDMRDEGSPHFPWPIFWQRALQEFNPYANHDWANENLLSAAMGEFFSRIDVRLDEIGESEQK